MLQLRRWGLLLGALVLGGCAPDVGRSADAKVNDVGDDDRSREGEDLLAIPRFSTAWYLNLDVVERISKFRSGIGHDFSDSTESCRSMKHYFCMQGCVSALPPVWTNNAIVSPLDGVVESLQPEPPRGIQVRVTPSGHPDWRVRIFHVTLEPDLQVGDIVTAGQLLGTHASNDTMSDIAVENVLPDGLRMVSWFETLSDDVFADLGVSRADLTITDAERDAAPIQCEQDQPLGEGADALENWVDLRR